MVVACDTEKVVICAYTVQNMIVVAQIGSIRATVFTSSTSVNVASCHLVCSPDGFELIAAWSKKLQKDSGVFVYQNEN
jgi:hypothetical protein